MDYDNFRQMVLGANLMPTKPGALEIYKTTQQMEFNHAAAINSIQHLTAVQVEGQGYNEEIVRETLALTQSDQLQAPRNQEEFQKFLVQKCPDPVGPAAG